MDFNTLCKDEFKKYLITLSDKYYNSFEPDEIDISDEEFDKLVETYEKRFNEKFNTLTSIKDEKSNSLPKYMHSLNKIKKQKDVELFVKKYNDIFIIMDKIDGVSALYYKKDNKKYLYTRGDGKEGSNISHLLKYLNLPEISEKVYIRGEIVMKNKNFEKYKNNMSNPRNMVSGLINSKTEDNRVLDLSFIAYELDDSRNLTLLEQLTELEENNFELPFYKVLTTISESDLKTLLTDRKKEVEYDIDGLVVSKNSTPFREVDKLPKDIIAFKMEGETVETTVEYIEWNISKNGLLKPRVKLSPVKLSGVVINWATGNNADFIFSNKICKDSIVEITRSGDVIPKIINVIKCSDKTLEELLVEVLPEFCKECEWKWNDTKKDIIITTKGLHDLNKRKIKEFFKSLDAKFVGGSTVDKIYDKLKENNPEPTLKDFLNLSQTFLLTIDGFLQKSVERILSAISGSITDVSIEDIASASGVLGQGLGKKKFKSVLAEYPDIFSLLEYKDEELEKKIKGVKGFKKMAGQFVTGLRELDSFLKEHDNIKVKNNYKKKEDIKVKNNYKKKEDIKKDNYKKDNLEFEEDEDENEEENFFKNKKIVFSNIRDKVLEKEIEKRGGEIMNNISKKTDLLVVDNLLSTTTKITKAIDLKIKIVSIDEFRKMF